LNPVSESGKSAIDMTARDKPRDIKERTFSFALDVVKFCRTLDTKPG